MQRLTLSAVLTVFTLTGIGFAFLNGSVHLPVSEVWQALLGNGSEVHRQIVQELRAPRVFAGFACGGLLAIAGTLLKFYYAIRWPIRISWASQAERP